MATIIPGIVTPTRKMTPEQLAEQRHFARRAARVAVRTPESVRGNRSAARRAAIRDSY